MKLLYAITAHGFGHATRACTVAGLLQRFYPELEITFSTAVAADAMQRFSVSSAVRQFNLRQQDYEPGLIQHTCFELDAAATRYQYQLLSRQLDQRVARETRFLQQHGFDAVLSDVAAIPVAAASELGLPAAVIGNFSWDWILQPVFAGQPELMAYLERMQHQYHSAAMYFRLPFHATQHPFRQVQEAPLIGRRSCLSRHTILSRLGITHDQERPLILVAVGGWQATDLGSIQVDGCADYRFLVVGDLPINTPEAELVRLPFELGSGVGFPDLVKIADAGIVKPGYGTCSEFVINASRMIGITRTDNREAPVLREATERYIPYRPMSLEDFLGGQWRQALDHIMASSPQAFPCQEQELETFAASIMKAIGR
jgi:hypothetical protein